MTVLPIVERELRVALRKHQPVRRRLRFAAACAGGALLFILLSGLIGSGNASHDLHQLLCLVGLYIVGRAPQLAAGIFAQERREQTLGLLILSGLSAGEVFASKLFSAAALVFADFLAVVPLMALPFLMGGISFELFVATICCLPNILLFALAASLLASVLAEDDGTAVLIATGIALVLCAAPPTVYVADGYFSGVGHPSAWWLRLSPAYGPYLVFTRRAGVSLVEFWRNFAITLAWSGVCLAAAAWLLKRLWRKRENQGPSVSWRLRWNDSVRGSNRWRRGLALQLLDRNPFTWLALRDRNPVAMAWSIIGGLLSGWVLCWIIWPDKWPTVVNFFITATVLNLTLRWIIHHTAALRLGAARRDGSYELLLTTPLQPGDIVSGQLEALREQFRSISRLVLGIEVLMTLIGLRLRHWDGRSLFVYFGIWAALLFWEWRQSWNPRGALLTMWASLNSGCPARAVWRAMGFNSWVWLWILFNFRSGLRGIQIFPAGSFVEIIAVSFGMIVLLIVIIQSKRASDSRELRLVSEFREIVREPVPDPNDPRFKNWNVRERFPWGWQVVQQQLHERVARREREYDQNLKFVV